MYHVVFCTVLQNTMPRYEVNHKFVILWQFSKKSLIAGRSNYGQRRAQGRPGPHGRRLKQPPPPPLVYPKVPALPPKVPPPPNLLPYNPFATCATVSFILCKACPAILCKGWVLGFLRRKLKWHELKKTCQIYVEYDHLFITSIWIFFTKSWIPLEIFQWQQFWGRGGES